MGVYIKGKRKPDTCYDCDFVDGSDDCFFGLGYTGDMCDCVYEDCPLIEIKTPHGRIIAENEITVVYGQALETHFNGYTSRAYNLSYTDAPTVIEAEI